MKSIKKAFRAAYGELDDGKTCGTCGKCVRMRLAARISDLRRAGHKIGRRIEKGTNRFGETVHYAVYWLEAAA